MRGRFNRPLVLAVAAVFALVAVVAVASTGSTPAGSGDTRKPHETLLDSFFTFGVVALIPAAVIFVYGLMQRKEIAEEMASGRYRRTGPIALIVFFLVVTGIVYLVRDQGLLPEGSPAGTSRSGRMARRSEIRATTTRTPTRPSSPGYPFSSSSASSRRRSRRFPSRRDGAGKRSARTTLRSPSNSPTCSTRRSTTCARSPTLAAR